MTDNCTGCGKCVNLCLLNNVKLENENPLWGKELHPLYGFYCRLSRETIEYGKKRKASRGIISEKNKRLEI